MSDEVDLDRRAFLRTLATAAGAVVLVPAVSRCGGTQTTGDGGVGGDPMAVPMVQPAGWDPIAYNKTRGNAGAIPNSYLPSINGPDGPKSHLGKHLPYTVELPKESAMGGFLALMWGDPSKGHAKHPNAVRNASNNNEGHWYDWIKVRKAVEGPAEELQSTFSDWPGIGPNDSGAYAVFGDGQLTDDKGKNTIYLAALPKDVKQGDRVRIWAHCLTHGEYVDFLTV